ncbi:uncharacterized protein [Hyperolius riggenbachi]|uniref:uncharacterized protein isoform X1 n=1 Tax=Hyperolius riggenbachi TaxID=752182 RepID=UPI0035A3480D
MSDSPSRGPQHRAPPSPDNTNGDQKIGISPQMDSSSSPVEENMLTLTKTPSSCKRSLNANIMLPSDHTGFTLKVEAAENKSTNIKLEHFLYEGQDGVLPVSSHIKDEPHWSQEHSPDRHTTNLQHAANYIKEEISTSEDDVTNIKLSSPGDQVLPTSGDIKKEPYWGEKEKYCLHPDDSTPMDQTPGSYTNIKKELDSSNDGSFNGSNGADTRYITDMDIYASDKPNSNGEFTSLHTDLREEAYICTECGLAFPSISTLHAHHQATHPNKEYGKSVTPPS